MQSLPLVSLIGRVSRLRRAGPREPQARFRRAATLVELLVAIAIIAVLIALLLPGIQGAREAARRTQCGNHLRQLALGCLGHLQSKGHFPLAGKDACYEAGGQLPNHPQCGTQGLSQTGCCGPGTSDRVEWNWGYHILPWIEGQAVFDQPLGSAGNAVVNSTPIPIMYCPTRRPPIAFNGRARTDYAGCIGHVDGDNRSPPHPGVAPFAGLTGIIIRTGAGLLRDAHVIDGLSNTIMLGEKRINPDDFVIPHDENETYASAGWSDTEVRRRGNFPPEHDSRHPSLFDKPTAVSHRFGSSHTGVCSCAFGDGSVRWISFEVDQTTFQRACRREDRQPVSHESL